MRNLHAARVLSILLSSAFAAFPLFAADGQPPEQQLTRKEPDPTILSIVPAQGEPARVVTLYGNSFLEGTTAYLGADPVPSRVIGAKQMEFDIPPLAPGLYALYLKRTDGALSRTYNFSVLTPKPVATSLSTDRIYACSSGPDREVSVSGRNFIPTSQVVFDGAAVRTSFNSPESVSFTVPPLRTGLHQIQVKNADDSISGGVALFIDSKPEIRSVSTGEDRVSDYDLVIDGINFQQGSTVVVDGTRLSTGASLERDRIVYVDCTKIVYQRHPYDSTAKTLRIQIVNPAGEESAVVQVNAP